MDFTRTKSALEARGFAVSVFGTAEAAANYLDSQIDGMTVACGGSITIEQLNLFNRLAKHNDIVSHWHIPDGKTSAEIRRTAALSQVYLCSANGLAETGEIINIDATGNRVSSTLFGHEIVYFVIGRNKIAPTYDEALWRARNIAAPQNAKRRNCKTPCTINGNRCYNCSSPDRSCKALVVLWEAIESCKMEVLLIDEVLGY